MTPRTRDKLNPKPTKLNPKLNPKPASGGAGNFPNPLMYNYDLEDPRQTPKWGLGDLGLKDNAYYDCYKFIFPPEARGDGGNRKLKKKEN